MTRVHAVHTRYTSATLELQDNQLKTIA